MIKLFYFDRIVERMLKIRLQRRGKRGDAHYRVVVIQSHRPRDSKFIEDLGYYNPHKKPSKLDIDLELTESWLEKGAQPTDTVAQFLHKEGLLDDWRKTKHSKLPQKKSKKKEQEEAPKEAAPAEKSPEKDKETKKDNKPKNEKVSRNKHKSESNPKPETKDKPKKEPKNEKSSKSPKSDKKEEQGEKNEDKKN